MALSDGMVVEWPLLFKRFFSTFAFWPKMLSLLCTQDQTNVNKSFHKGGVKATKTYFDSLLLQRAKRRLTPREL